MSGMLHKVYVKLSAVVRQPHNRSNVLSRIWYGSQTQPSAVTEGQIRSILSAKFPNAKDIKVEDTSGGCGAMFNIYVETDEFKGLAIIKQHRLVYSALEEQIKSIHGLHVETKAVT